MPLLIAALDTDVLVPILACDFLLTAFDHQLYEPAVSTTALIEVERTLLTDFPRLDPAAVGYRVQAMRDVLEDHLVDGEAADVPNEVNVKDRHVVGAAIQGEASILVTNDSRLRREVNAVLPELHSVSLDHFALALWRRSRDDVSGVVDDLVAKRTNPPITRDVLLAHLRGVLPSLVDRLLQAAPG